VATNAPRGQPGTLETCAEMNQAAPTAIATEMK
jgi:hypothetical protein